MSSRSKCVDVHGIVLLDKPAGISSNLALQKTRRLFDARKAGHTGNLDPFATGMLPVCLGEASKTAAFMLDANKRYLATARFGQATSTGDPEGEIRKEEAVPELAPEQLQEALKAFEGEIDQVPPMYSALKHQGRPLYELAREGKTIERKSRRVTILEIRLVSWLPPELVFEVECSKGTYVRTLAEDIAASLGTCAHLIALRRLRVQPFQANAMVKLDALALAREAGSIGDHLLPVDAGLQGWPMVEIDARSARYFTNGNPVSCGGATLGQVRVYGPRQRVLGLGECTADGRLHPRRVFNISAE